MTELIDLIDHLIRLRKQALRGFRTISRLKEAEILTEAIMVIEGIAPRMVLAEDIVAQIVRKYDSDSIPTTGSTTVYADAKMVHGCLEPHPHGR